MANTKLTTCPETGENVELTLERTPSGVVVHRCSRFADGMPTCSRLCAADLDHDDRAVLDTRDRVLIVLANLDDDAAAVGRSIAGVLRDDRLSVEIADLGTRTVPPLDDYDAIVIGAHVRLGAHPHALLAYVRDHRGELARMPAFFFSVGGRWAFRRDRYIESMSRKTGWHPQECATFADASELQRPDVAAFARLIADEVPSVDPPSLV